MIKVSSKTVTSTKVVVKGLVVSIEGKTVVIEDPKEGKQEFNLDILDQFIGKEVNISVSSEEED